MVLPQRMGVAQYRAMLPQLMAAASKPGRAVKRRQTPEEDLQMVCFTWAGHMMPQYPILKWMVHVPNGGKRTKAEAGRLKAMGVKKGVLDVLLPRRYRGWPGLAIELKSKDGRLSTDQEDWLAAFQEDGYVTGVCRTLEEFQVVIKRYLGGNPEWTERA